MVWTIFSPFRKTPSPDSFEEKEAPSRKPSLSLRICQTAATVGLVGTVSGAVFEGVRGDRLRCAANGYLAAICASSLWLSKESSSLRDVSDYTKIANLRLLNHFCNHLVFSGLRRGN